MTLRRSLFLLALLALWFLAAGGQSAREASTVSAVTSPQLSLLQTSTETPTPGEIIQDLAPIATASEAISRSLDYFPSGHTPHSMTATLSSYAQIDGWRGLSSEEPDAPAWLVGIVGDSLTVGDVMFEPAFNNGVSPLWSDPVDGAFYVWDANGGWLAGQGVLSSARPFSSLLGVPAAIYTIVPATEVLPLPTIDPNETPTYDPIAPPMVP